MTRKAPKSAPPSDLPPAPAAPAAALERPQELKNWSFDLVRILKRNESSIFDDFEFSAGRLTRADLTRTMQKIHGCGSVVELRAKVDRGTGEVGPAAVHAANYCGQHTICPLCAARVQDRRKARFREPIMAAAREFKHAYLVTATIPPVPTWSEDLSLLLNGWKGFRKMGQVRRRKAKDGTIRETRSGGEWGKIRAGISKVELKRGDGSGLPHCHVHALFFTDALLDFRVWTPEELAKPKRLRRPMVRLPISAARLSWGVSQGRTRGGRLPLPWWSSGSKIAGEWLAATDGATGINVKKIKWRPPKRRQDETGRDYARRVDEWSLGDSVYEQAREVLKYATKFDTSPAAESEKLFARDFASIKTATYGRRLFQTYGAFRAVGGDDYTGSQCPLSENPIIYEARWRTDRYSPLMERPRAVFGNCEPGPGLTRRLKVLNRIQGQTRRIRSAIHAAKREFLEAGRLGAAHYVRREFLEDGGFVDHTMALEVPGYILAAPRDLAAWERWQDDATAAGRGAYAAARENLDLESHLAIVGTVAERAAQADSVRRAWRLMPDYADHVVRAFMEVLAPSSAPP